MRHIKPKHKRHISYYLPLMLFLSLGVILTLHMSSNKPLQMLTVVVMAMFYVLWGILHHVLEHDSNTRLVIEYVLIGSLGMSLMFFLLKGAFL